MIKNQQVTLARKKFLKFTAQCQENDEFSYKKEFGRLGLDFEEIKNK